MRKLMSMFLVVMSFTKFAHAQSYKSDYSNKQSDVFKAKDAKPYKLNVEDMHLKKGSYYLEKHFSLDKKAYENMKAIAASSKPDFSNVESGVYTTEEQVFEKLSLGNPSPKVGFYLTEHTNFCKLKADTAELKKIKAKLKDGIALNKMEKAKIFSCKDLEAKDSLNRSASNITSDTKASNNSKAKPITASFKNAK